MIRPVHIFPDLVVLELKFTNRFPNWFSLMVQRFNLMQLSSAKYAEGVTQFGEHWFQQPSYHPDWLAPRAGKAIAAHVRPRALATAGGLEDE
jgi:hypothetical protein